MGSFSDKTIASKIFRPYGLEIELEGVDYDYGKRVISHKITSEWDIKTDSSLEHGGIEIVSPVLENNKENIVRLKKLSKTLKFLNPSFNNASFQINFDAYDFNDDDILNLLKMYSVYENVICRFSMGDNESLRCSFIAFAIVIQDSFYYNYYSNDVIFLKYLPYINTKTYGISLKTLSKNKEDLIKVIEFRTPNGTADYRLWLNYIVFFSSFLAYIKSSNYDREMIDYKFKNLVFKNYDEMIAVDEENANSLSDLIFVSDEDANNFKEQYFSNCRKSF